MTARQSAVRLCRAHNTMLRRALPSISGQWLAAYLRTSHQCVHALHTSIHRCSKHASRQQPITINGTKYRAPQKPSIGVCLDGCDPAYIDAATKLNLIPFWQSITEPKQQLPWLKSSKPTLHFNKHDASSTDLFAGAGHSGIVSAQMPTFTNPNNMSIATGSSAAHHGIVGNYYYDSKQQKEVMMNTPDMLQCDTLFHHLHQHYRTPIRIITVKDKLLKMLSHKLPAYSSSSDSSNCISISVESLSKQATSDSKHAYSMLQKHQRSTQQLNIPTIYEPEISHTAFEVAIALLQHDLQHLKQHPDAPKPLYYISTTDFVQHKFAPHQPEAMQFLTRIDELLHQLYSMGGVNIALTADHGMNDKHGYDGQPRAIYLSDVLQQNDIPNGRIILPITDPYVRHHGAFGGYATIYLDDKSQLDRALLALRKTDGIYTAMNKYDACMNFELPHDADTTGDIVVVGDVNTVLGKSPADHDLTDIHNLRSHGSLDEIKVPFMCTMQLSGDYARKLTTGNLRNWHLFDALLNGPLADDSR